MGRVRNFSTVFYRGLAFQELSVAELQGITILYVDHLAVPTSDSRSCTKHYPCSMLYITHTYIIYKSVLLSDQM